MVVPILIDVVEKPADAGISARAWAKALKSAHLAAGRFWQRELLLRHFKPGAKGRYQYQPRARAYIIEKLRLAKVGRVEEGGQVDLVFSGTLRQFMQETGRINAYPTRVTIRMDGPRYIGMVPRNTRQPNKAQEILSITDDERASIREVFQEAFDEEIIRYEIESGQAYRIDGERQYTGGPAAGFSTSFFTENGE
jgi:hypothetical protein